MSGEGGFFHHRNEEDNDYGAGNQAGDYGAGNQAGDYGSTVTSDYDKQGGYGGDYNSGSTDNQEGYGGGNYNQTDSYENGTYQKSTAVSDTSGYDEQASEDTLENAQENVAEDKRHEHLGEGATLAAGAYALYERHEAKEDPENAGRHTIEEEVGAAAAVGAGGYAFHEHHQKEEAEDEEENAEGKKHSSWFG